MQQKKQEEKKDIFSEAAIKSIEETVNRKVNFVDTKKDDPVKDVVEAKTVKKAKNSWDTLLKDIDGKHARRLNNLLENLPDREFVRIYLKVLEFAKPKIVRQKRTREGDSKPTLNININYGNQNLLGAGESTGDETIEVINGDDDRA